MEKFLGRWEVTSTENMDQMLKAIDMDETKRKMYTEMKFTMEYTKDGDDWSYTVFMPQGSSKTFNFRIGEEFDSYTLDGRPIISRIDIKDGRFEEFHKDKNDTTLDAVMIREIVGDELHVTAKVRDVTSVTKHKRV